MSTKFDRTKGVDSRSALKRNTTAFLEQLRATGQPVVLTINGQAEVVVQDAGSYQRLLELVDRLEAIEGIKRGLDDVKNGHTCSLEEISGEKRRKHGLPGGGVKRGRR
jgi:PHD/YefM family antitoxin component YafN of YafNO toxin-antitoxin module